MREICNVEVCYQPVQEQKLSCQVKNRYYSIRNSDCEAQGRLRKVPCRASPGQQDQAKEPERPKSLPEEDGRRGGNILPAGFRRALGLGQIIDSLGPIERIRQHDRPHFLQLHHRRHIHALQLPQLRPQRGDQAHPAGRQLVSHLLICVSFCIGITPPIRIIRALGAAVEAGPSEGAVWDI